MDPKLATGIARQDVRATDAGDEMYELVMSIGRSLVTRFRAGRRLQSGELTSLLADVERMASEHSLIGIEKASTPSTRARPKGEAHERRFVFALASNDNETIKIHGMRIYADLRRVKIEAVFCGMGFYLHTAARTMEREGIKWMPGQVEAATPARAIGTALVSDGGLLAAMLFATRNDAPANIALPFADGLLLGTILKNPAPRGWKVHLSSNKVVWGDFPVHPILSLSVDTPSNGVVSAGLRTYVGNLFRDQAALRSRLQQFRIKHQVASVALRRRLFWPDAEMFTDPPDIDSKITEACLDAKGLVQAAGDLRMRQGDGLLSGSTDENPDNSGPTFEV